MNGGFGMNEATEAQDIYTVLHAKDQSCAVMTFGHADLRHARTIRILEKEMQQLPGQLKEPHLIVDMTGVKVVPTAILGLMLQLVADCKERNIACRFCCLDISVKKAFELLNVNKMVDIFRTRAEALQTEWKKKHGWWPF